MTSLIIRELGLQPYQSTWKRMRDFTLARGKDTSDEVWLLQHPSVFTLGVSDSSEHVISPGDIPVVKSDRGGQVTYHGPGQLIAYLLLDLKRRHLGVRDLVCVLEKTIVRLLADYHVKAYGDSKARGVYVDGAKICSIGLRVSRSCSYHGLALNVAMDLEPFSRIHPCGFVGLPVTQLTHLVNRCDMHDVCIALQDQLQQQLVTVANAESS